jgi:hypothetical protein
MVQLVVEAQLEARPWALLDLQGAVESNADDVSGLAAGDLALAADVRVPARHGPSKAHPV